MRNTPTHPGAMTPAQLLKRDAIRLLITLCTATALAMLTAFIIKF